MKKGRKGKDERELEKGRKGKGGRKRNEKGKEREMGREALAETKRSRQIESSLQNALLLPVSVDFSDQLRITPQSLFKCLPNHYTESSGCHYAFQIYF